jgi:hypothetical protein
VYWNSSNSICYHNGQVFFLFLHLLGQTQKDTGHLGLLRLMNSYKHLVGMYCLSSWYSSLRSPGLLDPQYGGSRLLWDIGNYLLVDMA